MNNLGDISKLIQINKKRRCYNMEQNITEVIYCIKHSAIPLPIQEYLLNMLNERGLNND